MPKQFECLQALRGIACLWVILFHISIWERNFGTSSPLIQPFFWFGFAGVDLFFVLSGFIITYAHWDQLGERSRISRYLFRRAWRIYPAYLFVLVTTAIVWHYSLNWPVLPNGWEEHGWRWAMLFPTQTLNPIVPQAWTLSYELLFYIAFASLLVLPPRWGFSLLFGWGAICLTLAILNLKPAAFLVRFVTSPLVLEFLIGLLVAVAVRQHRTVSPKLLLSVGTCGMALGTLGWYAVARGSQQAISEPARVLAFGLPAGCFVWGLVTLEARTGQRFPTWLVRLGDASYSIYLVHCSLHPILIVYGARMPHNRLGHHAWVAIAVISCIGFGWLVYWLVERPALSLASRKGSEPRTVSRVAGWLGRLVRTHSASR